MFAANISVVDPMREFGSPLGNLAYKERVDGWRMKQVKNVAPSTTAPSTTSQAASERGQDIDASTDVVIDESFL